MQISITIEPEMLKQLDDLAFEKYGKNSRSLFIKLLIKDYLMKEKAMKNMDHALGAKDE